MASTSRDWIGQWRQRKTKGFADGAILRLLQQHAKNSVRSYSHSRWRSTQRHDGDPSSGMTTMIYSERERERERRQRTKKGGIRREAFEKLNEER